MLKKVKQISYLSAIIFIVGSTIGAGIFVKNKSLIKMAQGDLVFVILSWVIAAFGMLCLGMALIEVSSAQKTNRGTLEWTKIFTPKWFHKGCINYMKYIFIPVSLFTMPIYVVSTFQEAGMQLGSQSAIFALMIAFGIFLFFIVLNLYSLYYGEVAQWIFTLVKAIPLIALTILAFINYGNVGEGNTVLNKNIMESDLPKGLEGISKYIVLIGGIPAISFAYDGFYNLTSLRNNLKEEKRIGSALILGVFIITSIYLILTVAFNVGSKDGTHEGIKTLRDNKALKNLFNSLIAIGILGIVNGYTMSAPSQFADLIDSNEGKEFVFLQKIIYRDKFNLKNDKQKYFASWLFVVLSTIGFYIIFGLIGAFGYNKKDWGNNESIYGSAEYLYSFSDILVNYTSLIIFVIIATCILGCIFNRKTKNTKVKQIKYFYFFAIIGIVMFYATTIFLIVEAITGMVGFNDAHASASTLKFIVLLVFLFASFLPYPTQQLYYKMFKKH